MARDTGMHYRRIEDEFCEAGTEGVPIEMLERFAQLIENAAFKRWAAQTKLAVEDEREACANVCDDIDTEYGGEDVPATWCARAIRARGSND